MNIFHFALVLPLLVSESSCGGTPTADDQQHQQQEMLAKESNMQVGMPAITNFQEKRMAKMIYELRDNPKLSTFSYITDWQGHLHKLCDSVGYGLPSTVQFTNPMRLAGDSYYHTLTTLPQADPNGLFTGDSHATWVVCVDPKTKQLSPIYSEPDVIVSQFPLVVE